MEIIVVLAVIAGIWWFITNNKTSIKSKTVIETKRTIKTNFGEQTITNQTVIDDSQTEIKPINQNPIYRSNTISNHNLKPTSMTKNTFNDQYSTSSNTTQLLTEQKSPLQTNIQFKECSNCKRTQPLSSFRQNNNQPDGLTKWCISCLDNKEKLVNPSILQGMKVCPKCKQNRRKSSFYPSKKYPDGLSKWCKYCLTKYR